jgi:hypothetical protein
MQINELIKGIVGEGEKKRLTGGKSYIIQKRKALKDYPSGTVCSVSTMLYAGQICLLHELIKIPTANTTAIMITAFFMANRF